MEVRRPFAGERGGEKVRVKGKSRAPLCREGKGMRVASHGKSKVELLK